MNVVVTKTGFFTRLKNSVVGILIGIVAVLGSMWMLGWNEFRTVKERKGLDQASSIVQAAALDRIDPNLDGKLVYLSGRAETASGTLDAEFQLQRDALALFREVEMYQWAEKKTTRTEKNVGGGETTTTTYSYSKKWSDDPIDSNSFNDSSHRNPGTFPITARSILADDAKLGAYGLTDGQIGAIGGRQEVPVSAFDEPLLADGWKPTAGFVFRGNNPQSPDVGDLRLRFTEVPPTQISLVAAQTGGSFTPFLTSYKTSIDLLETGAVSVKDMFEHAHSANSALGWVLRGIGFAVMWLGFAMTLQPLRVLADVIPPIGRLVGGIGGMLSFLLAAMLSALTISIAWMFSRPLMVLSVLTVGIGVVMLIGQLRGGSAAKNQPAVMPPAAPPPPPPPPPRAF